MRVTTRDLRLRSCTVVVAITLSGPSPSPAHSAPDDGFGGLKCDHASAACDVGAKKGGSPALARSADTGRHPPAPARTYGLVHRPSDLPLSMS